MVEEKPIEKPLETPSEVPSETPSDEKPEEKKEPEKPKPEPKPKPEAKPEPPASAKATADKKVAEKAEEKVEVPAKFKKMVDEIEKMSIMDLSELVKILEKKFGVSPMMAAPAAAGVPTESGGEGKTEFTIELKSAGDQKINVIRVVREVTGKGLKEAKDLVDSAPKVVKENVKKEEAEEIKKKFEAAGASVELK